MILRAPKDFRVIAHRGASAYAPENTLPAFQLAKEMGVKEVELDVQLSKDKQLVICHDDTLERYGHGNRIVEALTLEELLSLDMGSWFSPYAFANTPMLTLEALLNKYKHDFIFHIELKGKAANLAKNTFELVKELELVEKSIFTSFSLEQLIRLREVSEIPRLAWLVNSIDDEVLRQAEQLNLFQLCPRADLVSPAMVKLGHSIVEEVRAWGLLGNSFEVRRLSKHVISCRCDGLTINWPDWIEVDSRLSYN